MATLSSLPDGIFQDFLRNPVALFNHDRNFLLGSWKNIRVEGGALRAELRLAPAGTSLRIDEVRKLVEANVLRATSVGFRALESKPRGREFGDGVIFTKSELVEASLVSVPSNPNCVANLTRAKDALRGK